MTQDSFVKALNDLLADRANNIDFSEASLAYRKNEEIIDGLSERLKLLLDEDGLKLLLSLDTEHNGRMTKAAEISYQKGFTEGIRLIIYSLMNS